MRRAGDTWLMAAFVLGVIAIGLPFWSIPYQKVNLPNALLGPLLAVLPLSAFVLCAFSLASPLRTGNWMAAAVPTAVMLRVVVEGLADPTSHNLWPFELVIAVLVGYVCALPAAFAGYLAGKAARRLRGGDDAPD